MPTTVIVCLSLEATKEYQTSSSAFPVLVLHNMAPIPEGFAPTVVPLVVPEQVSVPEGVIGIAPLQSSFANVPVPVRLTLHGFSSLSLLAIEILAVLAPAEDGVNWNHYILSFQADWTCRLCNDTELIRICPCND